MMDNVSRLVGEEWLLLVLIERFPFNSIINVNRSWIHSNFQRYDYFSLILLTSKINDTFFLSHLNNDWEKPMVASGFQWHIVWNSRFEFDCCFQNGSYQRKKVDQKKKVD